MIALRLALNDYLTMRRALGYKLQRAEKLLVQFVGFVEASGSERITSDLALAWATLPAQGAMDWWAGRLTIVRGFASYLHTLDPTTEMPPTGLLPAQSHRHAEHAELIQRVLAIPPKRCDRALISFLTRPEVAALLASPDRSTWTGRRDHALLQLAVQTGLRASEPLRLTCSDLHLGTGPYVSCRGKGRKNRITPLIASTVATLRTWLAERGGGPTDPLFPTRRGRALSRDAVEHRLAKYVTSAARACPSFHTKRVSAHVLRHTAVMQLLHADVDTSVIALWLGHESVETTQIYLHADMRLKERALARTRPAHPRTRALRRRWLAPARACHAV